MYGFLWFNICQRHLNHWIAERRSHNLTDSWTKIAETELPTKIERNPETSCIRIFRSQNRTETPKTSNGSQNFRAEHSPDSLWPERAKSRRPISFDLENMQKRQNMRKMQNMQNRQNTEWRQSIWLPAYLSQDWELSIAEWPPRNQINFWIKHMCSARRSLHRVWRFLIGIWYRREGTLWRFGWIKSNKE
jgi:hypothetical protein